MGGSRNMTGRVEGRRRGRREGERRGEGRGRRGGEGGRGTTERFEELDEKRGVGDHAFICLVAS